MVETPVSRSQRRRKIIDILAEITTGRQVNFSIRLQMDPTDPDVRAWLDLRAAIGLHGYPTREEAIEAIEEII